MSLYVKIADDVPQIARGKVWCTKCGRMERVVGSHCLKYGWPECCGETMTVDSPQWRTAHKRKPTPERQQPGSEEQER